MQFLQALFKQFWRAKIEPSQRCRILELPDEIILIIANHLALYDKFILFHTCRTMLRLMSCPWEREFLRQSSTEKIDCLLGIAHHKPDRWVCASCCKLHVVNLLDHPLVAKTPPCVGRSRLGPLSKYNLEHHHIQLALKLSRLGVNRSYLKKLLAPCTNTLKNAGSRYNYTAQPKVIEDRFVLFEKMTIGSTRGPLSQQDMEEGFIMICPHLALPRSYRRCFQPVVQDLCPSTALDEATTLALNSPGLEMQGRCEFCPTDYTVLFTNSQQELTFNTWHDFGTSGPASSPFWSSQVWIGKDHQPLGRSLGEIRNLYLNSP
ncbi:hypothetical protein V8C37DRAFT_412430 [Trichoderma ceciliae]